MITLHFWQDQQLFSVHAENVLSLKKKKADSDTSKDLQFAIYYIFFRVKYNLSLFINLIIFSVLSADKTARLVPEEGSVYNLRVQHYRELLDSLPMDAYTHGCILHPELTAESMIPAYATSRIRCMYTIISIYLFFNV